MTNVAIVGFGYIGSVMGAVLAEQGHSVVGIDQNEALISNFALGRCPIPEPDLQDLVAAQVTKGALSFSTSIAEINKADVIIVTVGTPLSPETHKADLSHIRAACESMAPFLRDGQLVILKSTVPPGVTRTVAGEALLPHAKIRLAFSPERLAEGQAIRDFKTLPIVVGGIDEESTRAAAEFWRSSLGVQVMELTSPEAAELVKLANNLWIDLNVALAHDLAKLCDALPYTVDVLEVIAGANTLKKGQHYTNILTPSNGVGGYCLTKDPWFVWAIGKEHGVDLLTPAASRSVNDSMPGYVANQILAKLSGSGVKPADAKIAVMGLAFKTNSGDLRFTPVGPFLDAVHAAGVKDLAICDPMVVEHEATHMGVTLTQDWREALRGANCAAFFAGHDAFKQITVDDLSTLLAPGALVYDGRMYFSRQDIAAMTAKGLVYQGVGRS
jgi:UDP-N-acetyl-D-mannosaminuronic acid dehydrogenase